MGFPARGGFGIRSKLNDRNFICHPIVPILPEEKVGGDCVLHMRCSSHAVFAGFSACNQSADKKSLRSLSLENREPNRKPTCDM